MVTTRRPNRLRATALGLVSLVALTSCGDPRRRVKVQALSFGGSGHRVSAEIYIENTGTGTPFRWSRLVLRMPDGSSAGVGELPPDTSDFMFVTLPFVTSMYWMLPRLPHERYELTCVGDVLARFTA